METEAKKVGEQKGALEYTIPSMMTSTLTLEPNSPAYQPLLNWVCLNLQNENGPTGPPQPVTTQNIQQQNIQQQHMQQQQQQQQQQQGQQQLSNGAQNGLFTDPWLNPPPSQNAINVSFILFYIFGYFTFIIICAML